MRQSQQYPKAARNDLLEAVRRKSRVIDIVLNRYGQMTLGEYVKLFRQQRVTAIQPADDFLQFALEYNEARLGSEVALELDKVLRFPVVNTANHHGVDYFPPSIQGNLLFWKALVENGIHTKYLPICSFGIVTLSNSSYARGLTSNAHCEELIRIPIYPEDARNKMVRYMPAFTREQIQRSIHRTKKNLADGAAKTDLLHALETYYLDQQVLSLDRYGDQAVLLNKLISRDMFPQGDIPEIIYMEMEHVFKQLLLRDLDNEDSLLYRMLYDPRLKREIMFFWGVDAYKRRFMMEFGKDRILRGTTMAGEEVALPAGPEEIKKLIEHERIISSGYTMAVLLCFARGYTWLGGYFQGDYLPEWQEITIQSLVNVEEYRDWADKIALLDCSGYISGPLFAMIRSEDGGLAPAGPLEIIRSGGLTEARLDQLLEATVAEAHVMGLSGSYPDTIKPDYRMQNWRGILRQQLTQSYSRFIV